MKEKIYRIRHIPSGRFYKGSTYSYVRRNPELYIQKVFTVSGKSYSKLSWAKSGLTNITDSRCLTIFPWNKLDFEIVEYEVKEIGCINE